MAWQKGQSGNPNGRPKGTGKSRDVEGIIRRGSRHSLRLLVDVVRGKGDYSSGDRLKAAMYLVDRDLGKPESAGNAAQGLFAGATIMVDTGIKRGDQAYLESPTIEAESHARGAGLNGSEGTD